MVARPIGILRPVLAAASLVLATVAQPRLAHADRSAAAAAEALFEQGRKLVLEKKLEEACQKFEESNRLDRAAGTLMHLGDCFERSGKTASAWVTFQEAAQQARTEGHPDWAETSKQRADKLKTGLARLTIHTSKATPDLRVTQDGVELTANSFDTPIPVDPGKHNLRATAKGYATWESCAVVSAGESVVVEVPPLRSDAPPAMGPGLRDAPPAAGPARANETSILKPLGFAAAGTGIAALAVGGVFGVMSLGNSADARAACALDGPCGSAQAVDQASSARSQATASTVFIGVGLGLAGLGAALIVLAPSPERAALRRIQSLASGSF